MQVPTPADTKRSCGVSSFRCCMASETALEKTSSSSHVFVLFYFFFFFLPPPTHITAEPPWEKHQCEEEKQL